MNLSLRTSKHPGPRARKPGGTLVGLALDGEQLEVVVLRRTNGSLELQKSFTVALSLNPLTNEAALVGREIRKHLDEAGIRERRCVVGLPLSWLLALHVALPDLPDEDLGSVLEIEAERGFPYAPENLVISRSLYRLAEGKRHASLMAVPRDHVARLEAALTAAQLRPVSFSLGITALPRSERTAGEGVMIVTASSRGLGLLVTAGGGVAALRSLESVYEDQGGARELRPESLARELRITLGQLPAELSGSLRQVRVIGQGEAVEEVEEALQGRAGALGLALESVRTYRPGDFSASLPVGTPISAALSLAAHHLAGHPPEYEFLPPKVTAWQQLTARYASQKLVWVGSAAAAVVAVALTALLVQQVQLWYWGSKWKVMETRVLDLEQIQKQTRTYRAWYDESIPTLGLLRRLTEAFPEDGTVSARSVELREPALVTCTGTARDRESLLRVLEKLRAVREVANVKLELMRGRTPLEFSFNFQWVGAGGS